MTGLALEVPRDDGGEALVRRPSGIQFMEHDRDDTRREATRPRTPRTPYFSIEGRKSRKGDSPLMRKLRSLDLDKDGRISSAELECAVEQLVMEERKHQNFKIATCAVVALLVFVLLANMGLAYAVLVLSRETKLDQNVLVSKHTGAPVEVESSSFEVKDHSFRARGDSDDGLPLETILSTKVDEAHASYSDDYLSTVDSLRLSWPGGGSASLRVHGFARPPSAEGAVDSVTLLTVAGEVTICNDGAMQVDENIAKFLLRAGAVVEQSDARGFEGSSTRRLLVAGFQDTYASFRSWSERSCESRAVLLHGDPADQAAEFERCMASKEKSAARRYGSFVLPTNDTAL